MSCLFKGESGTAHRTTTTTDIAMWFTVTCAVLLLMVSVAEPSTVTNKKRCGRYLRDALSLVCASSGFHGPDDKRGDITLKPIKKEQNFIAKQFRRRIRSTQIVDECCRKPCSMETLRSYCKDDGFHQDSGIPLITSEENANEPSLTSAQVQTSGEEAQAKTPQEPSETFEGVVAESADTETGHEPFGSFAYPGKKNYRYIWAVVYDDPQANLEPVNE